MPVLGQLLEKYPREIKVVHKAFPLRNHQFAFPAAAAAVAAHMQGKFWPFHDKVFDNLSRLSDEKLVEIAKETGLDMARFERDRKSPAAAAHVNGDLEDGMKADVRGTPSVFINGRQVRNWTDAPTLHGLIDAEIKKAKKR